MDLKFGRKEKGNLNSNARTKKLKSFELASPAILRVRTYPPCLSCVWGPYFRASPTCSRQNRCCAAFKLPNLLRRAVSPGLPCLPPLCPLSSPATPLTAPPGPFLFLPPMQCLSDSFFLPLAATVSSICNRINEALNSARISPHSPIITKVELR